MSDLSFDKDKVLERVKKMLALANDAAASEGERDNALRMAHATLAKYNLSLGDATKDKEEARVQEGVVVGPDMPWMRVCAQAVANLFFCDFYYIQGRPNRPTRYYFIGKQSNVITSQGMMKYVIDSIRAEGKRAARDRGESSGGTFWRSFCKGAAVRVSQRCKEIRENAERASGVAPSTGTSLVLSTLYQLESKANQDFLRQQGVNLRTAASRERNTSMDGYVHGKAYGDKIGLGSQITSQNKSDSSRLLK